MTISRLTYVTRYYTYAYGTDRVFGLVTVSTLTIQMTPAYLQCTVSNGNGRSPEHVMFGGTSYLELWVAHRSTVANQDR